MGRRVLRMSAGFLPVLLGKGVHHYFVGGDALPDDCAIVDASVNFPSVPGAKELVVLLESDEWEHVPGVPTPEVKPYPIEHHCH